MNQQGFVHIVEVVLISVVIIASLAYIIRPIYLKEEWKEAGLKEIGKGLLTSLERKGELNELVFNRSVDYTEERIDEVLGIGKPSSINYNFKVEGAYKNVIKVGYNCTGCGCIDCNESETGVFIARTAGTLGGEWLNGRFITFRVFPFPWGKFTGTGKNYDPDVIFFSNFSQVVRATNHLSELKKHLSRGRGVVEFLDLNSSRFSATQPLQKQLFGLETTPSGGTGNLSFVNRDNPFKRNYEISKIFYGVGSRVNTGRPGTPQPMKGNWTLWGTDYQVSVEEAGDGYEINVSRDGTLFCQNCVEGDQFTVNGYDFSVDRIKKLVEGAFRTQIVVWFNHLDQEPPTQYEFKNFVNELNEGNIDTLGSSENVVLTTTDGEAGMIVNESVNRGRAVWLSKGRGDDVNGLAQSAVIWAAPSTQWKVEYRAPGKGSTQISYFGVNGEEIYEPYKVTLTLWYIY